MSEKLEMLPYQVEGPTEFTTYRTVAIFDNLNGGGPVVAAAGLTLRNPNVYLVHNVPSELTDQDIADRCRKTIFSTERRRFFLGELATEMTPNEIIND